MSDLRWSAPDGVGLAGERHAGSGPLVVLLHAGFQSRTAWRTAVGELAVDDYDVIAYDLRGHGDSGWSPSGDYRVAHNALDLLALLEHLERPAALIGSSLGGATSLAVAGHADPAVRARVTALVLVDVTPRVEEGGRSRVRGFVQDHLDGFATLEEAAEKVARYAGGSPRPGRGLTRHLTQHDDGRYRWRWDPRVVVDGLDAYGHDLIQEQLAASRRLSVPTLLLRGGESDVTSLEGAQEFLAAAPHAAYREIPGAGHMVTAVPNDPYVAAATEFVRSLDLPRSTSG